MREYDYPAHQPLKEIMMRFFLQLLPTAMVVFYILWNAEYHVVFLQDKSAELCLACGTGMLVSLITYQSRLRFIPSFLLLLLAGMGISVFIRQLGSGDIESFFLAHRFKLYFFLFCTGWVISFGLMRIRFFPALIALLLVGTSIWISGSTQQMLQKDEYWVFFILLIPVLLYGAYIIFISEQLKDYQQYGGKGAFKMLLNAIFFICLASLVLSILLFQYKDEIRGTIDQLTSGKYEEKNSMLQKSEDGTSIKNSTSLSNNNHRENELLLAVYIDNFFENSDIPNPLYLTSFYYAKFDTATETFEIADDMPDKDLFRPDPGRIPLYQTVTDSGVLAFTGDQPGLKTVEIEVYNKGMTFADFVAPTTAFSVQPIAVDIAYQKEYKSAYIARSMVSELNSAYFVYNVSNPEALKFQNARYAILRNVQHFGKMDSAAYAYYTELPDIESLREVRNLAYQIAGSKDLPIDKIIAIKDFFLSKDANGKSRFQYSDNPGIPDIPSAKNLNYFLFENRKGFCAHYAGATLFLLRSLGIPSRITAGFLVEDRSTTNPGWYYLYADQVHAWVQVYFPGYGWLDFDTTVGNEEARESDQPDATPPLEPKKATLTFSGYISSIDTSGKTVSIQARSATFYDQNFNTEQPIAISLDISISRIVRDTSTLSIYDLSINDTIAAVSYAKNQIPTISQAKDMGSLADQLAEPVPIDLLQVRSRLSPSRQHSDDFRKLNKFKWKWVSYPLLGLLVLFFLVQLIPVSIKKYFSIRAKNKNIRRSAYFNYLLILYYLWMMKIKKHSSEPMSQFAKRVDHRFDTEMQRFIITYQKLKYGTHTLPTDEQIFLTQYGKRFTDELGQQIPAKERRKNWLFIRRALRFVAGRKENSV